jgi:chaperonin cofactor prefoldin
MSEEDNLVEQLKTKISNLESEVATLSGENDRLQTEIKTKNEFIEELEHTQK